MAVANTKLQRGISFRMLPDQKVMTIYPPDFIPYLSRTAQRDGWAYFRFIKYTKLSDSACFARLQEIPEAPEGIRAIDEPLFAFLKNGSENESQFVAVNIELLKSEYGKATGWMPFTFIYTPNFRHVFAKVKKNHRAPICSQE